MAKPVKTKKGRITIYVEQEERQELLKKVLEYTRAESISEAVFAALAELLEYKEAQQKALGEKTLEESQGIWANDPEVERAFKLAAKGWEDWRIEGY